jgi:hypothetical protein
VTKFIRFFITGPGVVLVVVGMAITVAWIIKQGQDKQRAFNTAAQTLPIPNTPASVSARPVVLPTLVSFYAQVAATPSPTRISAVDPTFGPVLVPHRSVPGCPSLKKQSVGRFAHLSFRSNDKPCLRRSSQNARRFFAADCAAWVMLPSWRSSIFWR